MYYLKWLWHMALALAIFLGLNILTYGEIVPCEGLSISVGIAFIIITGVNIAMYEQDPII